MRIFTFLLLTIFQINFCFSSSDSFLLLSGNASQELSKSVADCLSQELSPVNISRFNDGEIRIKIQENVRNKDVFVIQSVCSTDKQSINDSLMELYLLIRTLKRSAAGKVSAVIPYYGYSRQDRKTESRVPISASDIAMLIEMAGADRVMCVDLHCGQIQGFFHESTVDNLMAAPIFVRYIADKTDLIQPTVVSPDAGGVERAKKFIEGLSWYGIDAGLAMIVKQRAGAGVIEKMNLVGDVSGKDVIIVDDLCDTAGTLVQAAKELKEHGANRVYACITHPILSGPALERIKNSELTELIVTDTIPSKKALPSNIVVTSIAPLIAEAIQRTHSGESISYLFNYKWESQFHQEAN